MNLYRRFSGTVTYCDFWKQNPNFGLDFVSRKHEGNCTDLPVQIDLFSIIFTIMIILKPRKARLSINERRKSVISVNPREHEVDDAVATIAHVTDFEPTRDHTHVTSPNFKSRRDSDIFRKISTDSSDKDYRLSAPQVQKDIEINKVRLKRFWEFKILTRHNFDKWIKNLFSLGFSKMDQIVLH